MLVSDPRYPAVVRMQKIQHAKEYATEHYNITRDMFIHMISVRYEKDEETYLFEAAWEEAVGSGTWTLPLNVVVSVSLSPIWILPTVEDIISEPLPVALVES